MPDLIVSQELQDYLVAQGVGQLPSATPSLTLPSVWLQPRDGAPQPRRGNNGDFAEATTVTLIDSLLTTPPTGEEFLQEQIVDIVVRARNNGTAKLLQRQIHGLVVGDGLGGRKLWTMGALLVEASLRWRGDQPLGQGLVTTVGQDDVTYTRVQSVIFRCRSKALAGLPYSP